jgi:uncharacterized Zn finger protein (UPF0148 family)
MSNVQGNGYRLKKSKLTGKTQVHYACRACGEDLHSSLSEAGKADQCPACGVGFTVPGETERLEFETKAEKEREAQRAEAQRRTEAAQQQAAQQRHSRARLSPAPGQKEYLVRVVTEGLASYLIFGQANIAEQKLASVLNDASARGWDLEFMVKESRRTLLFGEREAIIITFSRIVPDPVES